MNQHTHSEHRAGKRNWTGEEPTKSKTSSDKPGPDPPGNGAFFCWISPDIVDRMPHARAISARWVGLRKGRRERGRES
eukprot:3215805-Rhodomonas_salina.1